MGLLILHNFYTEWPGCTQTLTLFSPAQSPAGCREQVRDEPGHLSQGAFCFHRHRRTGLPHHRRGQHGQRRRSDPPRCECATRSSAPNCTRSFFPLHDSHLSLCINMHAVLIHSAHRDLNLLFPCLLFCWLRLSCISSSYFHLSSCPLPSLETYQSVPSAERVQRYFSVSAQTRLQDILEVRLQGFFFF